MLGLRLYGMFSRYVHCDANSMAVGLHDRELRKKSMMFGFEKSPKKPGFLCPCPKYPDPSKHTDQKNPCEKKRKFKHLPLEAPIILRADIFFEKKGDLAKNI